MDLKKQKHDPTICCLQETRFRSKNTNRFEIEMMEEMSLANTNRKRAGVATLISDKIHSKSKKDY